MAAYNFFIFIFFYFYFLFSLLSFYFTNYKETYKKTILQFHI